MGMVKVVDRYHSRRVLKVMLRNLSFILQAVKGFQAGRLTSWDYQSRRVTLQYGLDGREVIREVSGDGHSRPGRGWWQLDSGVVMVIKNVDRHERCIESRNSGRRCWGSEGGGGVWRWARFLAKVTVWPVGPFAECRNTRWICHVLWVSILLNILIQNAFFFEYLLV